MFAVFSFVLAAHLSLVVCFIINAPISFFDKSSVLGYYRNYAVLGPFFTDKSVSSTYLMSVSLSDGEWYYPQLNSHQLYTNRFNYQQLKRAEFEKLLSWHALRLDIQPELRDYLLDYLNQALSATQDLDSVRIMILNRYGEYPKIGIDTLKIIQYPAP